MNYYRLLDDIHFRGRWHLGELRHQDGTAVDLDSGMAVDDAPLHCVVTTSGVPMEFCLTSFNAPVVSERVASVVLRLARQSIQPAEVEVEGHGHFVGLNVTRRVVCLDEKRTYATKWTRQDGRPDKVGRYRMVAALHIDASSVPAGCHAFRVWGWEVAMVVSVDMKDLMESQGVAGAVFVPV